MFKTDTAASRRDSDSRDERHGLDVRYISVRLVFTGMKLIELALLFFVLGLPGQHLLAWGVAVSAWGLGERLDLKSRPASGRLVAEQPVRLVTGLSCQLLSLSQALFGVLTAEPDLAWSVRIRTVLAASLGRRTRWRATPAVSQFYGHRFEQDDDSFWQMDPAGLQGAVVTLS